MKRIYHFWETWVQKSEPLQSDSGREQWTQDVLQMMLVIISAVVLLVMAGSALRLFTWSEMLPLYFLFLFIAQAWWGANHGGWRWARFYPPVLHYLLGAYACFQSGQVITGLFFALAILLAGMLINQRARGEMMALAIVSMFAIALTFGWAAFLNSLGIILTNSSLLVGVALIQWYYDSRLQRILADYANTNHSLSYEVELRRQIEDHLREQETLYRRLAENSSDLICEMSLDGVIRYASPSYKTFLGYTPENLIGKSGASLLHPEDQPAAMRMMEENAAKKVQGKMQLRLQHMDGYYLYFETIGSPMLDEANNLVGFVVTSRDIHQQKLAEAATRESERQFGTIIQSFPMGIYIYALNEDDKLIFSGYNPAADRIIGIRHAGLMGMTIEEAFPGLTGTEIPQMYRQIAKEGASYQRLVPYYSDGINGEYDVKAFQTSPGRMVVTFMDVTEQMQANETLKESEEKFSKAFLISPDSININRLLDGLYMDVNQGFTSLLGYERDEAVGKTSLELRIWDNPEDRARLVKGLQERGKVENLEARFRAKNGLVRTALMSARIIEIHNEKCILSITRDISERKQSEQELQEAHALLEEAYNATLQGWVRALDLREHETADHSRRVVDLTMRIARRLGISEVTLQAIQRGALLHDIGKIGVPDKILLKPGPLSSEEWVIMRQHPGYAYDLLRQISYLQLSVDIPYCHHERWDGQGYPRGLAGEAIPLAARIFSVVDVFDALLSDRAYRRAWEKKDVIEYLQDQKGKQFDPQIVDCFFEVV